MSEIPIIKGHNFKATFCSFTPGQGHRGAREEAEGLEGRQLIALR